VAHQYIKQLEEEVAWAVFGNVGTLIFFRVGADDATFMENEFMPTYTPEDLVNLAKYEIYLKLMVDGAATSPFSANTMAPVAQFTGNSDKVIAVSRERYATPRGDIEQKVLRWSGMESMSSEYPAILSEDEQQAKEELGGVPASMKPGTSEYAAAGVEALEGEGTTADTGEYLKISPERLAAIVKPPAEGKKKDKPKFSHTCTRCGKVWDMPIQLDITRPIYCAECLPIVREERKMKTNVMKTALHAPLENAGFEGLSVEDVAPPSKDESKLVKTFSAFEEAPIQNKPRIVADHPATQAAQKGTIKIVSNTNPRAESHGLLHDLQQSKGRPLETNKQRLTSDSSSNRPRPAPKPPQRRTPDVMGQEPREPLMLGDIPPSTTSSPGATVFKSTVSSVHPAKAFTLEPTPHQTVNPLDKRMSHGEKSQASGHIPPQDPPGGGTLAPGQRVTF